MGSLSRNSPVITTTTTTSDGSSPQQQHQLLIEPDLDVLGLLRAWQLEEQGGGHGQGSISPGCDNCLGIPKDLQHSCVCQTPSPDGGVHHSTSSAVPHPLTPLLTSETSALSRLLLDAYNYERKQQDIILQLIEAFSTVKRALEDELMNGLNFDLGSVQALLNLAKKAKGEDVVSVLNAVSMRRKGLEQVLIKRLCSPLSTLPTSVIPSLRLINTFTSSRVNPPKPLNHHLVPPRFFFDMEISGIPIGRIVIETRPDVAPKMCENFRCLVTGERGFGFLGCSVFQCWRGESVITGDFEHNNGRGGYSIYDGLFMPEDTRLPSTRGAIGMRRTQKRHDSKGLVGSQFRIILQDMPGFTGIFGRVVEGIEVVDKISEVGDPSGNPTKRVVIRRCGNL